MNQQAGVRHQKPGKAF